MDVADIFRKLTSGARFNTKRFNSHARKFQMTKQVVECEPVVQKPVEIVEEFASDEEDFSSDEEEINSLDENGQDLSSDESSLDGGEAANGKQAPDSEESEEDEMILMGSIKAGKDGKPIKSAKIKKKKKLSEEEREKMQHTEEVNRVRNSHKMTVWTKEGAAREAVPEPVESFEQLQERFGVSAVLLANVLKAGYEAPTPIQMQAMPAMMAGRQVMACAPTGSGKTAAFLLPIVHQLKAPSGAGVRAIVVAPTRELAHQTHRECLKLAEGLKLRIHLLNKVKELVKKTSKKGQIKADILISTPNRLLFLLNQEPAVLSMKSVEWLVVDESDKLFEEGKQGFREQLAKLYQACDGGRVRRAMFSATHTTPVANWCKRHLQHLVCVNVGVRNSAVDLVDQQLQFVGTEEGKLLAFRTMVQEGLNPPVLIFVQTKDRAQQLFQELIYDGINVDVIHAGRTQQQRDNTVKSFREGKVWVLICTELLARGVDFKGVNMVINYDFPPSAISYIHRIGRTGRAGRRGKAVTFFTTADSGHVRTIASLLVNSGCEVPDYIMKLNRANKTERRERARKAPKRKLISTEPAFEREKRQKIQNLVVNRKRRAAKKEKECKS